MQDFTSVEKLQNATVYGSDGDKIGSVGQVYLDNDTHQPSWVTVNIGLFGTNESFTRTFFAGNRPSPILFTEARDRFYGPIFTLTISGTI